MTTLKLNISNENYKNLKKIYSDKTDFKNKRIVKYYKLNTKKPEICPFCKENHEHIHMHGYYSKFLKNLKIDNFTEVFNIKITRYLCTKCKKTFSDKFEDQYENHRITQNLKDQILEDFNKNTVLNDLKFKYKLPFSIIKSIFKNHIKISNFNKIKELQSGFVEKLSIDEKKIGDKFYTFFTDFDKKQVIFCCGGRDSETVKKFCDFYGENFIKNIKPVSIDMAKSFNSGVSKYIPNAEIVTDKFHFSSNFYKKYVKKIFENEIKKQKKSIKIMNKNTQNKENFNETSKKTLEDLIEINQKTIVCKFLLRKNHKNITEDDKKIIDFASENSENINEIVEIKYKIDELLDSKDYEYCKKEWLNLFEKCKNSTIPELRRFYKFNYKYIDTLPNSALFDISNGFIEGNNRNINLYYNRARGFKDIDYFLNLIMYFSYKKSC